ncbi:MAG: SPFH/Band 7/PHB domain protein [Ruminococcaceae bacterium]|nr:SPFH/Band 7/PHB domain protein [Oscillospiraceae bacterium]
MEAVIFTIIILVLIVAFSCIRIVPQASEYVIELLGKYRCTWSAGLHFKIPILERVARKITLKEQVLDSPPQPVITKDNVTMQIDTVVYYRIFDAKLYTYGVVNPVNALANLTATTLRNLVGELELDGTLTSRDTINGKMTAILDEATDQWGIKVGRVELKNIIPPKEIQMAMEKQMKAERDRRETLLQAEGHKAAAITRAEGEKQAAILEAEGVRDATVARAEGEAKAVLLARQAEAEGIRLLREAGADAAVLELKKYEALVRLSDGRASKIIIPTDTVSAVTRNVIFSESSGLGDTTDPDTSENKVAPRPDPCCD